MHTQQRVGLGQKIVLASNKSGPPLVNYTASKVARFENGGSFDTPNEWFVRYSLLWVISVCVWVYVCVWECVCSSLEMSHIFMHVIVCLFLNMCQSSFVCIFIHVCGRVWGVVWETFTYSSTVSRAWGGYERHVYIRTCFCGTVCMKIFQMGYRWNMLSKIDFFMLKVFFIVAIRRGAGGKRPPVPE